MGFNYEQYESVLSKNTNDFSNSVGWLNASGDAADLQSKLDVLYAKRDALQGVRANAQLTYDGFNAMTPCKTCKKDKETKENGKNYWLPRLQQADTDIKSNNSAIATIEKALSERKQYDIDEAKRAYDAEQIRLADAERERIRLAGIEQKRLEDAAKKVIDDAKIAEDKIKTDAAIELAKTTAKNLADAKANEQQIKKEIDLKLVDKGVIPEAELKKAELAGQAVVEAAKINATAQAKVTELTGVSTSKIKNYLMIGGFLVLAIGAFLFFRKKTE